jgi:hypothetical protein
MVHYYDPLSLRSPAALILRSTGYTSFLCLSLGYFLSLSASSLVVLVLLRSHMKVDSLCFYLTVMLNQLVV